MVSKTLRPSDGEMEILSVLWELGPSTVREVHDRLAQRRDIGYTTILKQMQIMVEKGLLSRDEKQRSHIYRARQKAEVTQRHIVKDVIKKVFSGATDKLVLHALSSQKTTPQQIEEIRKMLDKLDGGRTDV